jgi:hypothetical protein
MFEGKVWKIWIFEWILSLKIHQIAKIGFERENQFSLQCVHNYLNLTSYNNINLKKKKKTFILQIKFD